MQLADAVALGPDDGPETIGHMTLGRDGGEFTDIKSDAPITDWSDVMRRFNLDPEVFEVVDDTVRCSTWQQSKRTDTGDRDIVQLYSYRALFRRRRSAHDLPTLYATARRRKALKRAASVVDGRATVVPLADLQIGKVGSRGGTPELVERLLEKRALLDTELRRRRPSLVVMPDAGDLFENFESGGNPMFTNDLSLAQQLDMAATEVFEFVRLAARYGPVVVPVVTSNHTAWRRGKTQLGRPGDDLGIFVHRQVEKLAQAAGIDARWVFPPMYDDAVAVDVLGTTLGVVHGNQFRPGKAIEWWQRQQHGGQPVGAADVLVTAHYHHLVIEPTGRNPHTGRTKWWVQLPPLDNGSDWFRNIAGEDSDPGLVVFNIVEGHGFDLRSFAVL